MNLSWYSCSETPASLHEAVCSSLVLKTCVYMRLSSSLSLFFPSKPCPCLSKDRPRAHSLPPIPEFCNQSPLSLLRSHTSSWGCPWSSSKSVSPGRTVTESLELLTKIYIFKESSEVSPSKSSRWEAWYRKTQKSLNATIINTLCPPCFSTRPIAPNSFLMYFILESHKYWRGNLALTFHSPGHGRVYA